MGEVGKESLGLRGNPVKQISIMAIRKRNAIQRRNLEGKEGDTRGEARGELLSRCRGQSDASFVGRDFSRFRRLSHRARLGPEPQRKQWTFIQDDHCGSQGSMVN